MAALVQDGFAQAQVLQLSESLTREERQKVLREGRTKDAVVVALFTRVQAYDPTSVGISGEMAGLIDELARRKPTGVIGYGNPYVLNVLGRANAVISAYDVAPASLQAGVELLQGTFEASGQLPVRLEMA